MLGCSIEEAFSYIQSLFRGNMSWENRDLWDIYHIIPLAMAKTIEELESLCHYTNLQPLWKEDHRKKTIMDMQKIKINKNNKLIEMNTIVD